MLSRNNALVMTASTAILIAAYNAEATLERAVRSALAQPEAAEVCIIDDASNDGTLALARTLANSDPRVIVLSSEVNAGPASARNRGIAATSAAWITVLDADDYMMPGRLALLHAIAGECDFLADKLIRSDGAAPKLESTHLHPQPLSFTRFVLGNASERSGLHLGFIKPLFRREFVEAHRLRYREDMRLGEDYELYARALALGARFSLCEPAGYVSVERAGSLSKAHGEEELEALRDCDNSLAALPLSAPELRALRRHWQSVDERLQWRRLISAVKKRDVPLALSAFTSPGTAGYLATKLLEQAWLRGRARLLRRPVLSPSQAH